MAKLASGGPSLPEDVVLCEILTRLPAKPVVRCRAVCRSWRRRFTSDAKFLEAHHRRQPSLPLVTTGNRSTEERRIDALDHRTGERRPVVRTTGGTGGPEDDLRVLASCDGLIVLHGHDLEICNPTTRQRLPLTLLYRAAGISALYPHRPSGSYRVLCFFKTEDGHAVYHVHTVGSGEIRCVGEPPGTYASGNVVRVMQMMMLSNPPVLADGRIYWQPVHLPGGNGKGNDMLVFDTMTESFEHLLSPVGSGGFPELIEMSNGALGLYTRGHSAGDVWVLQDHKSWTWSLKFKIKWPAGVLCVRPVLNPEGDVLCLSSRGDSSLEFLHLDHISGASGSLLARYEWSGSLNIRRHRFKEGLVRHDFFSMEGNAVGVDKKPLFDGLSAVVLVRNDNSEPH